MSDTAVMVSMQYERAIAEMKGRWAAYIKIAMFDTPSPRRSNLAKIHRNAHAARAPKIVVT